MPDPTLKTVSATESAALVDLSPYATRFMLWQRFAAGGVIDREDPDGRMSWGTKMQPLLIEQAAQDLALEVRPNVGEDGAEIYHRRGLLGATRDATIITPDRGPGALDTKCCFDYRIWMDHWGGGKAPPKHIELQLQQQMFVGDGDQPFDHGRIAVWVCGEMKYFEREPIPKVWAGIEAEAEKFFESIAANKSPDPFGDPIELPWLSALDRPAGSVVDLSHDENLTEKVRMYVRAQAEARAAQSVTKTLKPQILSAIGAHEKAMFGDGITVDLQTTKRAGHTVKPSTSVTIKAFVPTTPGQSAEPSDEGEDAREYRV